MTLPLPGATLPADVLRLIGHVTAHLGDASTEILNQASAAKVLQYSATNIDVEVPPNLVMVPLANGPTPGRAMVYRESQLVSEVLVWIKNGRFIGLEQAWYTDEPPAAWPSPGNVRVE